MVAMGAPERRRAPAGKGSPGRGATGPGGVPPLLVVLGVVVLAAIVASAVVFLLVLARGGRGGQGEVVGSELPPVWQPDGGKGAGQPPPPPSGEAPPPPAGTPPPVPEVVPYAADPEPPPDAELQPPAAVTPGLGEVVPPPPEAPFGPSFEPPRLMYLPAPEYPRVGRRMGREGTVELQVLVDAGGRVRAADPVGERLGLGFEAAARRAAFGARFAPARRNGEPVESETRITIRFRLQ